MKTSGYHTGLTERVYYLKIIKRTDLVGITRIKILNDDYVLYDITASELLDTYRDISYNICRRYGNATDDELCREMGYMFKRKFLSVREIEEAEIKRKKDKYKEDENILLILIYWGLVCNPSIPDDVLSSIQLMKDAQEIQKSIMEQTLSHKKKVNEHYLKYGTMTEKFINYIKYLYEK